MIKASTEILIGALVVAGLLFIIGLLYSGSGRDVRTGYDVHARFQRLDGLSVGSEVRLSGIPVGRILSQELDEKFQAVVRLRIAADVQLPKDTAAAIHTDGLLGSKYIELQPGGDDAMIPPDGYILYVQNSVLVQDLLELIVAQLQTKGASSH